MKGRFQKISVCAAVIGGLVLGACGLQPAEARNRHRGHHPAQQAQAAPPGPMMDAMPPAVFRQMLDPTKAIGYPSLGWPQQVVTVAFNGGDPRAYPLIESAASEWLANGGRIRLSFRRPDGSFRTWSNSDLTDSANIRIAFDTTGSSAGYWSVIGVLAGSLRAGQQTMNLGDLGTGLAPYYNGANRAGWLQDYSHTVVLHEFGHALGLNHEHFHPSCQADLKIEQAVQYFMASPNNWSREQALFNVDARTYFDEMAKATQGAPLHVDPAIDRASVMLYYYPQRFFRSGAASPCNPASPMGYATALSNNDRRYFRQVYGGN